MWMGTTDEGTRKKEKERGVFGELFTFHTGICATCGTANVSSAASEERPKETRNENERDGSFVAETLRLLQVVRYFFKW